MSFEKIINRKESEIAFRKDQKIEREQTEQERKKLEELEQEKERLKEYQDEQKRLEQNPRIEKIRAMVNDPKLIKALKYMTRCLGLDYSPDIMYREDGVHILMIWGISTHWVAGSPDSEGGEFAQCECRFDLDISIDENGNIFSANEWSSDFHRGSLQTKTTVQSLNEILENMADVFIQRGGTAYDDHWGLGFMAKRALERDKKSKKKVK